MFDDVRRAARSSPLVQIKCVPKIRYGWDGSEVLCVVIIYQKGIYLDTTVWGGAWHGKEWWWYSRGCGPLNRGVYMNVN